MKRKIIERNKPPEMQAVQMKTTAHHQPTDAQPVPEQQPPANLPHSLYAEYDVSQRGTSLWSVRVGCPDHVPSQLLVHPSPSAGGAARDTEEALRLCEHCSARNETSLN